MTFDELDDLIENNADTDSKTRNAVECIIQAEIDWVTGVESLEEFIEIVENEVDGELSLENVANRLKVYQRNVLGNAWEAESFTSLLEVFNYDEQSTLNEILKGIINNTKNKVD